VTAIWTIHIHLRAALLTKKGNRIRGMRDIRTGSSLIEQTATGIMILKAVASLAS
jgi:hypothetical protein